MFLFQPGSPGSPVRVLVFRPVVQVRVEREAVSLPLMIRAEVGYRLQGKKETLSHTALFLLVVVEFITIYFSGAPLLLLQVDKTSLY